MSVSLLAVAAIAASLFLGRHREAPQSQEAGTSGSPSPARDLDAIRAAGL